MERGWGLALESDRSSVRGLAAADHLDSVFFKKQLSDSSSKRMQLVPVNLNRMRKIGLSVSSLSAVPSSSWSCDRRSSSRCALLYLKGLGSDLQGFKLMLKLDHPVMEEKPRTRRVQARIVSCASSNVGSDVWFEILKRLPVKDIIRCRCVCRTWCSLVASPLFINDHLEDGGNRDLLLFTQSTFSLKNPLEAAKFSLLESKTLSSISECFYCPIAPVNNPYFQVVGSVHGLICLSDNNCENPTQDVTLIWNPWVCRYIHLPQPPSNLKHDHTLPHDHFSNLRFTFNPIKKDYMVVRVMYCHGNLAKKLSEPPVVEFYSVSKREWKTVSNTSLLEPYTILEKSCSYYRSSVDGAVCWISWKRGSSILVLFSAVECELKRLALPEQLGSRLNPISSSVVEFKGLLSVMEVTTSSYVELAFNIWSWIDKEDQWCQMISINTAVDGLRVREHRRLNIIYQVTDDERVIGSRAAGAGVSELVIFHPHTNQIDRFWEHENDFAAEYMGSYMQSLLLLDLESGAESYNPAIIPSSHNHWCLGPRKTDLGRVYNWKRGILDKYRRW